MKNSILIIFVSSLILLSCKKEDQKIFGCTDPSATNYNASATDDNGSCTYNGNVTFWYNSNGTNATVNIGGQVGYITSYYPGNDPSCGSTGCANFTLGVGSYNYSASSTFSNWSGTVSVTKNGCKLVLLQ